MSSSIVVADADALIALVLETDPHHNRAVTINNSLTSAGYSVVFPVTVFPEVITFLKRASNQPAKAHLINKQLQEGLFHIEYLNESILLEASRIFSEASSKKNTFFDAIVAATAKELGATIIFSFDNWYPKLGLELAKA